MALRTKACSAFLLLHLRHWMPRAAVMATGALAGCMTMAPPPPAPPPPAMPMVFPLQLTETGFPDLQGWTSADPRAALEAFRRSCGALAQKPDDAPLGGVGYAGTAGEWREACSATAALQNPEPDAARNFFEAEFVPYRLSQGDAHGLFTGYYEPELMGSRSRHGAYQTPLYGLPGDLVSVDLGLFRDTFKGQRLLGRVMNGRLVPYPAREEIVMRGLGQARPLFYVEDPVDAFFLQVQGSGRVMLDDGTMVRAAYAGQNGQPYTAIGAVLIEKGELKREDVSLQSIRAWLMTHPAEAPDLLNANASYVFLSEAPIGDPNLGATGSEGVPLTPEASLAVDLSIHPLGAPVWLEGSAPETDAAAPDRVLDTLLVMQDTGGAIRGAIRGDVYWGYGAGAGSIAGRMKHEGRLTVLLPKPVAARLGPQAEYATPP
jgi:membrane-bound lytic murein transglycosylase A